MYKEWHSVPRYVTTDPSALAWSPESKNIQDMLQRYYDAALSYQNDAYILRAVRSLLEPKLGHYLPVVDATRAMRPQSVPKRPLSPQPLLAEKRPRVDDSHSRPSQVFPVQAHDMVA